MIERNQILIDLMTEHLPGFEVRFKSEVWHQRLLGWVMLWTWRFPVDEGTGKRKLERTYMTKFTSFISAKLYLTSREQLDNPHLWRTLAHEFVHGWDAEQLPPGAFPVWYLVPQVLILGGLAAIGAIWIPWMLWFLLALVFALPWPAPGRAWAERRGYSMTMACRHWVPISGRRIDDEMVEWVLEHFTKWPYYRMWPFESSMRDGLNEVRESIESGDILEDPPFRLVYDAIAPEK